MRTLYALIATLGRALLTEATLVGCVVLLLLLAFLALQAGALVAGCEVTFGKPTTIGRVARAVWGRSLLWDYDARCYGGRA